MSAQTNPDRPMRATKTGRFRHVGEIILGLFLLGVGAAQGQVKLSAEIDPPVVSVGEQATYTILISGVRAADEIPTISAPEELEFGLPVRRQEINLINGQASVIGRLSYPVMASEEGEFEIPQQIVKIQGKRLVTNATKLTVRGAGAPGASRADPGTKSEPDYHPLLEMNVGKTSFYVGEIIPVTVTLYTLSATPLRNQGYPELDRSQFVLREFPRRPQMGYAEIGGASYHRSVFASSLSGIRPGTFSLGPAVVECVLQIPDSRFGLHPFLNLGSTKRFRVTGKPIELDVKPLPEQGKPQGFGGLVGQFQVSTAATPIKLKVGDPVSLTLTIRGRGNLDEVEPLTMATEDGWKAYPATVLGEPEGQAHGERKVSFNHVLIPTDIQEEIPSFSVPYFDPDKGEYVMLRSDPIRIEVSADPKAAAALVAPTGLGLAPNGSGASGLAAGPPVVELGDIVHVSSDRIAKASPTAMIAPHKRSSFLLWQILPAVLLGILLVDLVRKTVSDRNAVPAGSIDVKGALDELQGFRGDRIDFLRRASEVIHAQGGTGDPALRKVVADYETLHFSGAADATPLDGAEQEHIIEVLRTQLLRAKS